MKTRKNAMASVDLVYGYNSTAMSQTCTLNVCARYSSSRTQSESFYALQHTHCPLSVSPSSGPLWLSLQTRNAFPTGQQQRCVYEKQVNELLKLMDSTEISKQETMPAWSHHKTRRSWNPQGRQAQWIRPSLHAQNERQKRASTQRKRSL